MKIGDLVPGRTAERLPVGTVIVDQRGEEWELQLDGWWDTKSGGSTNGLGRDLVVIKRIGLIEEIRAGDLKEREIVALERIATALEAINQRLGSTS